MKKIFISVSIFILIGCSYFGFHTKYDLKQINANIVKDKFTSNYSIKSLSGKFTVSYYSKDNRGRTEGKLYINNQDTVYMELWGPVGEREIVLLLTPDSCYINNYVENIYLREIRSNFELSRILPTNLSIDLLIKILLEKYNLNKQLELIKKTDNKISFQIEKEQFTFDERLLLLSYSLIDDESISLKVDYDYFFLVKNKMLPRYIKILNMLDKQKLTLFFDRLSVNQSYHIKIDKELYDK